MQRGVIRRRSTSSESDSERPTQRQRQSMAPPPLASSPTSSSRGKRASTTSPTHSTSSSPSPIATRVFTDMGPPISTRSHLQAVPEASASASNGHHSNASPSASSSSRLISDVHLVKPDGHLMYSDEADWAPLDRDADTTNEDEENVTAHKNHITRMPVNREEAVRLILQGLRDIGYNQSANVLEAESGYQLATPAATDFQAAIVGGRWSEATELLPLLGVEPTVDPADPTRRGQPAPLTQSKFLISQQKYLEYLEVGSQKKALHTLRTELAPLAANADVLHTISGYMMCLDKDDLYERAVWDGAAGSSRRRLLEKLQEYISPQLMVPQRRLATLFDQARQYQISKCLYHEPSDIPSLYIDHECVEGHFPSVTTHILADHTDEVWRIEWSPDGSMLASAGKDRLVVLWQLDTKFNGTWTVRPVHHLESHREPVDCMAWSPDSKTLVTGADKSLYMWNTETGRQKTMGVGTSPHMDQISAIQWKADGSEFIVSSLDCNIIFYNPSGTVVRQWSFNTTQIMDFVITPDMSRLIGLTTSLKRVPIDSKLKPSMSGRPASGATGSASASANEEGFGYGSMEHALVSIRLSDKEIIDWSQDIRCEVSSIKLSKDGKFALISCNPDEIQLWSLQPTLRVVRTFRGHVQSRYLLRSSFGAPKDRFVLTGSEDGHVYVWQKAAAGPAIQVLQGHSATVNCVAWNPDPAKKIFASCSDDGTVRLWQVPGSIEALDEDKGNVGGGGAGLNL